MTGAERGFLLLGSTLGDPERRPLSTVQLRKLGKLMKNAPDADADRELSVADLTAIGCGRELAERIWLLLEQEDVLEHYLRRGGCYSK